MNRYGRRAQRYWQANLPSHYAQIPDQDTFFDRMGQTMANQIEDLAEQIAGPDQTGETYLDKLGRLNRAQTEAETQIMWETLPPPESTTAAQETIEDQDSSA